jgi:translocation and assembly module TamA
MPDWQCRSKIADRFDPPTLKLVICNIIALSMMLTDTPRPAVNTVFPARSPRRPRPPARWSICLRCAAALLVLFSIFSPGSARAGLNVNVEVKGISDELLANVQAYLSIEQQKFDPNLTELQLQRLHQRAATEITKALQPFGYYDPQIHSSLQHINNRWLARYDVDPGPPVLITSIDIRIEGEGKDNAEFRAVAANFPLHRNEVLNQPLYEKGKRNFQRFASEHGYFDFKWQKSEIAVDPTAHTAAITLHIDSGPRYYFGTVDFKQNVLRPSLIQRFVPFKTGDPYSTAQLLDLQSALIDSNYFRNVEINPRRDLSKDHQVPIDVDLTPRDKQLYTVGVGYGTDSGARGKLGWENRRINDRGHRFSVEYNSSSILDSLTARYIIPIRNPRSDQFAITSKVSNDYLPTSKSETFLVGVSRSVDRGNNWLETLYLNYQTENYSIAGESGNSVLLLPGITMSKVSADNRIYPLRGIRLLVDVRGANPAVISNAQYLQVRAQVKFVHKLFGKGRILLRGDVGATRFGALRNLPPSQRFFAGGDQSVRGYAYNSLGPHNAAGQVIGGEQLLVGSVEYEQRFTDKWSAAIFYDTGNAINDWQDALKEGVGFGVRWRSPIGPIRFDLGFAISDPGTPKRLHINVGPDL